MIKTLIESGADVAKKAIGGGTPFDWAKEHEEAQRLLKVPTFRRIQQTLESLWPKTL
jgi:hypothetical protein